MSPNQLFPRRRRRRDRSGFGERKKVSKRFVLSLSFLEVESERRKGVYVFVCLSEL
jgi:hypothetical protein